MLFVYVSIATASSLMLCCFPSVDFSRCFSLGSVQRISNPVEWVYAYTSVCVCLCVCVSLSIYVCVCVCVCMCQLSADHESEIEELWTALVACWPGNLLVIMRYLVIIVGMYPHVLLPWVSTHSLTHTH